MFLDYFNIKNKKILFEYIYERKHFKKYALSFPSPNDLNSKTKNNNNNKERKLGHPEATTADLWIEGQ